MKRHYLLTTSLATLFFSPFVMGQANGTEIIGTVNEFISDAPPSPQWQGQADWSIGLDDSAHDALPDEILSACLGYKKPLTEVERKRWEGRLFPSANTYSADRIDHRTVPIPFPIPGTRKPRLWVIAGNHYCVLDHGEKGGWRRLAQWQDVTPVPIRNMTVRERVFLNREFSLPNNFAWERSPVNHEWRLLLFADGDAMGGSWSAETISLSDDGRQLRRSGERQDANSAFESLQVWSAENQPLLLWTDERSNGDSHYCGMFSRAGGLDRPEYQRQIIAEELKLGRRISDDESMALIGGEARACLGTGNQSPPSECGWLSESGIAWGDCKSRPGYDEFAKQFKPAEPERKPAPPREINPLLQLDLHAGLHEETWLAVNPVLIEDEDRRDCIEGRPENSAGYLPVPYALPMANLPTLTVTNTSLCLLAALEDGSIKRFDRLLLKPELPVLRWAAWIPGATVRYRYLVLAGSAKPAGQAQDLRLYRLDLAEGKLRLLHRLSGPEAWMASGGEGVKISTVDAIHGMPLCPGALCRELIINQNKLISVRRPR